MAGSTHENKAVATRFIEGFNTDDWDTVREVVAADFVFHHPDGGTVAAGPEGMVAAWTDFKAALPDSWHPIPIMIAEGEYVAVLLPTYGRFTGRDYHGIPPTERWLEYGMVNLVRIRDHQVAEAWFGMDSLAEKQQMDAAPPFRPRRLSDIERANVELFLASADGKGGEFETVTAFDDVVVALGPPQYASDTKQRHLAIYRVGYGTLIPVRSYEFPTIPPYGGQLDADAETSRALVDRFFDEVLNQHHVEALARIVSPDILIHRTALPCEASFYGVRGAAKWLGSQWEAFPDLAISDYMAIAEGDIVVARWEAHGTSMGEFMGMPPSGEDVQYSGVSMYRVEDDRIAEIWETRNTLGLVRQVNMRGEHH